MNKSLVRVHVAASLVAIATLATFLGLAVASELSPGFTPTARTSILRGLLVLVPALMAIGITGLRLARKHKGRLVEDKLRRMKLVAVNGLFVLLPCAIWLAWRAETGHFDTAFGVVQLIELVAGAANLRLLLLNLRDGMRLSGGRRVASMGRVIRRA